MKQMIRFLLLSAFCFVVQFSYTQTTGYQGDIKKHYKIRLKPIGAGPMIKGYLSEVGDTLAITPFHMNQPDKRISLDRVEYMKFKKHGKSEMYMVVGGLVGFGLGALYGFHAYEPCPPQQNDTGGFGISCLNILDGGDYAMFYGVIGSLSGIVIGAILGRSKMITIQGSKQSRKTQKEEIRKYQFRN